MALLLTALTACSVGDDTPEPGGRALSVVATTTQVGSVAAEIGGDAIDLVTLLQPGVETHDFELTPAAGAALEAADLILVSGAGLEDWLDDTIETIGHADRVRDMSVGIELRMGGNEDHDDEDGHDEDGHEEGVDPHYWLTADNAVVMVANVRAALVEVLPGSEDAFTERADALIARLEAADAEVHALIGEVPQESRKIVTDHDALGYFIEAYGLELVGSVFPSLDVSAEPSAQEVEALVADIREHGVTAIFTESAVDPRLARVIADETDARLVQEPLYTDSLGPAGSGADTLDGMLLHNARVIRDGLLGG